MTSALTTCLEPIALHCNDGLVTNLQPRQEAYEAQGTGERHFGQQLGLRSCQRDFIAVQMIQSSSASKSDVDLNLLLASQRCTTRFRVSRLGFLQWQCLRYQQMLSREYLFKSQTEKPSFNLYQAVCSTMARVV